MRNGLIRQRFSVSRGLLILQCRLERGRVGLVVLLRLKRSTDTELRPHLVYCVASAPLLTLAGKNAPVEMGQMLQSVQCCLVLHFLPITGETFLSSE